MISVSDAGTQYLFHQIDIKRSYKESSSSEEERQKTKKAIKKVEKKKKQKPSDIVDIPKGDKAS